MRPLFCRLNCKYFVNTFGSPRLGPEFVALLLRFACYNLKLSGSGIIAIRTPRPDCRENQEGIGKGGTPLAPQGACGAKHSGYL